MQRVLIQEKKQNFPIQTENVDRICQYCGLRGCFYCHGYPPSLARAVVHLPDQVTANVSSLLSLNLPPSRSSEHDLGEDIYDCVPCEDEGDDIYEDIIRVEVQQPMVTVYMRVLKL